VVKYEGGVKFIKIILINNKNLNRLQMFPIVRFTPKSLKVDFSSTLNLRIISFFSDFTKWNESQKTFLRHSSFKVQGSKLLPAKEKYKITS